MFHRLRQALNSPYPFDPSPVSLCLYGLGSGLFVWFFFVAFEPLGFSLLPAAPRRMLFIGYGAVTSLAIVANGLLLPRLRPGFFREENWSLGRQIFWMGWVTLTIGLGCYLLSGAVCSHYGLPAHWVRLRTIVLDTFLIGIFPITVINLANYARLLRRNTQVVQEANRRLERPVAPPPPRGEEFPPQVEILAENNRDSLRVPLPDLLYIQAEENYVQVHARGDRQGHPLLRSSLSRVERQLRPFYPRLFRCHRAFIVHTACIARVEGNAQGLTLSLKDSPMVVPVARRYVAEFRRLMRGL